MNIVLFCTLFTFPPFLPIWIVPHPSSLIGEPLASSTFRSSSFLLHRNKELFFTYLYICFRDHLCNRTEFWKLFAWADAVCLRTRERWIKWLISLKACSSPPAQPPAQLTAIKWKYYDFSRLRLKQKQDLGVKWTQSSLLCFHGDPLWSSAPFCKHSSESFSPCTQTISDLSVDSSHSWPERSEVIWSL